MQPTPGDVHVNRPLTNMSVAYIQKAENFIATRVFPNIPVSFQSDRYYTYDRGEFNRDEMTERAPGTESEGGSYKLDNTPTYYCRQYSWHKDVPDPLRANADEVVNPDRDAMQYCALKGLIKREKLWVANYFKNGVWTGGDYAGVAGTPSTNEVKQWNDANSNPIEDVRFAKSTVLQSTGFEPNKLVLGRLVYDKLVDHPDIIDRIKYGQSGVGQPAMATREALAKLFEVDEVLVMNSIENTAKEGQTAAHSFIGGKKALLAYAPPAPGLLVPSAGYTFSWTGLMGSAANGQRIRTFRMEQLQSDRVEIDMSFDLKQIGSDLGFFWNTIVA